MLKIAFAVVFTFVLALAAAGQSGDLIAFGTAGAELGACPLKSTRVRVGVGGIVARVNVVQTFSNPFPTPVEAVYKFPLSADGAVDSMTMTIGERVVKGSVMTRAAARKVYERARGDGRTAALLDQERPNIFTQRVANILPGDEIRVEISYVETLRFENGAFEFVFPTKVAPRYSPASMASADAERIAAPSATRAGHTISIDVDLDAALPLGAVSSPTHEIDAAQFSASSARVSLRDAETLPNKDFVLRWDVTGARIDDALLTHRKDANGDGFFTLVLAPPDLPRAEDVTPKEIVFLVDSSGSMNGFPYDTARRIVDLSLGGLYRHDTFNVITFAGDTRVLFDKPVPATQANVESARALLDSNGAGGGTEMLAAIRAALAPSGATDRVRIVCFLTDGQVGNDDEIVAEVKRHPDARVFSYGLGQSVNRSLIDAVAREGRGEASYLTSPDGWEAAAATFYERVRTPLLTDVSVDWNGLPVADVYPKRPGDLFAAEPLVVTGRYLKGASGKAVLRGKSGGLEWSREIDVELPESRPENDQLASLWARSRVAELASRALAETPARAAATRREIAETGLKFGLLTEFTSFVAVDDRMRAPAGNPQTLIVPAEKSSGGGGVTTVTGSRFTLPSYSIGSDSGGRGSTPVAGSGLSAVVGDGDAEQSPTVVVNTPRIVSLGVVNGKATNLAKPEYPAAARAVRAKGAVNVQIVIDENGFVVSATTVSGHPLLRAAAATAARASRFSPTMIGGRAVRVTGVIVYNFIGDSAPLVPFPAPARTPAPARELTPEMKAEVERVRRERELAARRSDAVKRRLHFRVYELLAKFKAGQTPLESSWTANGYARLELTLAARTPSALKRLAALGFEITTDTGGPSIAGRIPLEKLEALAAMAEISLIVPG